MNQFIKEFLQNSNNQNLLNKNEWKAILLSGILDASPSLYNSGGIFAIYEEFTQLIRDANIPIDNYFDQVFGSFEVKKQFSVPYFDYEREWTLEIIGNTEKEFHPINIKEGTTYSDLWFIFVYLQNKYNLDLFPGEGELNNLINYDNFKIISSISIDVDNTYLIYTIDIYEGIECRFSAYKYIDTLGRIIPGYGYGYNLSEFDKLNQIVLDHLKSKGLELK